MHDIFVKIIGGEIPSAKIYEDDETFAFLDIRPCAKGHALVVPKKQTRNLFTMSADEFARLMETVHNVAIAVRAATHADGINIVMNNEPAAGQEVFHAHVHVIPRKENDGVFPPPHHSAYADGEIQTVAEAIQKAFA